MNRGEPLNIKINHPDNFLAKKFLEAFPKANSVANINPLVRARVPK
jgi:hypothetical protein